MKLSLRLVRILLAGLFFTKVLAQQEIFVQELRSTEVSKLSILQGASGPSSALAVASADNSLKILDAATHAERLSLTGVENRISSLLFIPDSRMLVGAGVDGRVVVWNTSTGAVVSEFKPLSSIAGLGVFQQNKVIAASLDGTLRIFDPATGKTLDSFSSEEDITCLAVHPRGNVCALGSSRGRVYVYDLSTFKEVKALAEVQTRTTALDFSPDGRYLVAGAIDGSVHVWDMETLTLKGKVALHRSSVLGFTFDSKNRWLVSIASDSSLKTYSLSSQAVVKSLIESNGHYTFVSFVSDEIMCAGSNRGVVKTWRVLDVPPDTVPPTIVMLEPSLNADNTPAKFYGTRYEVQGFACDDSLVQAVTINGVATPLEELVTYDTLRLPPGMKAKGFRNVVSLKSDGLNVAEIKAVDWVGNSTLQTVNIRRVSPDEAIEVVGPANDSVVDKVYVRLQFRGWLDIASYAVAVNLVEMVDNRRVQTKRIGEIITEEIPLIVGYNQIQLSMTNKNGEKFAKTLGVNRNVSSAVAGSAPSAERGTGPQRWAVVVGISQYANPDIPPLKYADADAEAFAEFLRTSEGGGFDNDHIQVLINRDATIANVQNALSNFLSQAIDIDLVIVYFAGHGVPEPARPTNLYLLSYDSDPNILRTTAFPMWQIQDVLARYISAKRIIVFSDACHSGGISEGYATRGLGATKTNLINQYLSELARSKEGVVVFTASAAGEVSRELPEFGHGVFTHYLLKGLKGEADFNNDFRVTINELMQFVEEQVKRTTRGAQNPTRSQTTYDKDLSVSIRPH